METIVIHEKKSKAFRLGWTGLLMSAASIALLLFGFTEDRIVYIVIGIVASIFFIISSIAAFIRALRNKPLLEITGEGIIDTSSASSVGFVPFTAIESIRKVNVAGQKVLGVELSELETFLASLSPAKQRSIHTNQKMHLPPVVIRLDTAENITLTEVYNIIIARHPILGKDTDNLFMQ